MAMAVVARIIQAAIRTALKGDLSSLPAYVVRNGRTEEIELFIQELTQEEREIIRRGSLINYNRSKKS